jgi:hypothetical protein
LNRSTFANTGAFTMAVHRWAWITESDGTWQKWVVMPTTAPAERTRLVSLAFDDILNQRFGPTVDAFMPPGTNDEDT